MPGTTSLDQKRPTHARAKEQVVGLASCKTLGMPSKLASGKKATRTAWEIYFQKELCPGNLQNPLESLENIIWDVAIRPVELLFEAKLHRRGDPQR